MLHRAVAFNNRHRRVTSICTHIVVVAHMCRVCACVCVLCPMCARVRASEPAAAPFVVVFCCCRCRCVTRTSASTSTSTTSERARAREHFSSALLLVSQIVSRNSPLQTVASCVCAQRERTVLRFGLRCCCCCLLCVYVCLRACVCLCACSQRATCRPAPHTQRVDDDDRVSVCLVARVLANPGGGVVSSVCRSNHNTIHIHTFRQHICARRTLSRCRRGRYR